MTYSISRSTCLVMEKNISKRKVPNNAKITQTIWPPSKTKHLISHFRLYLDSQMKLCCDSKYKLGVLATRKLMEMSYIRFE